MKRLIILLLLVCALVVASAVVVVARIQCSRGLGQILLLDVTQPMQKAITAPTIPFRNGALFVAVDGQLDGNATLLIISNHGRDRRTEVLSGTIQNRIIGGAEEWVDDLVVRFEPGSAKQGHIRIEMACGKNLKRGK